VRPDTAAVQKLSIGRFAAVTIGELGRGIEFVRHRGDVRQAQTLERWLGRLLDDFGGSVLAFDADMAQVRGRLRMLHPENPPTGRLQLRRRSMISSWSRATSSTFPQPA
jgi:hypothetical protein